MNKKLICFILILSFLVPFLPVFDFSVSAAEPTVSMNDYMDSLGFYWDSSDNLWKPKASASIGKQIEFVLADNGYVIRDDPMSVVIDYIANQIGVPYQGNGYTVSDAESIASSGVVSQNIINYSTDYAKSRLSYYIYDFININDFFTFYNFSNFSTQSNFSGLITALTNLCSDSDYVYFLSSKGRNYNYYILDSTLVKIPRDFFDSGYLVLSSGSFSDIVNYRFQSFRIPADGSTLPSNVNVNGRLSLYSDFSYVSSPSGLEIYDIKSNRWGDGFESIDRFLGVLSDYPFQIGVINNSSGQYYASFSGTAFIYSGESFSIPVFRSTNLISDFQSGNAAVYKFNSSVDLGQYGEDLDYSKLYDIISTSIRGSNGNVIQAINNAADNYLQQQIDLLHDINNALNDGSGQSWLRRIYNILDFNFPRTLAAFSDLQNAIENLSISGGSADLTYTNQVLDQINDKLGILIDQPFSDATVEDMEDLKNLAFNKFPFCVFSDIVAISVILNQPPEQPHWQIPMKLPGSESANNIEIDLSWYEEIRDIVYAVFIFIFIIGLLALSVKIFQAVKD